MILILRVFIVVATLLVVVDLPVDAPAVQNTCPTPL